MIRVSFEELVTIYSAIWLLNFSTALKSVFKPKYLDFSTSLTSTFTSINCLNGVHTNTILDL